MKSQYEVINGVLWLHADGRTWSHDARPKSRKGKRGGAGGNKELIEAPMPGKITKLFHKNGEKVHKGGAIVVMEAMKMEYTLKAEIDGEVLETLCQPGDQVTLGQALVKMKPATTEKK